MRVRGCLVLWVGLGLAAPLEAGVGQYSSVATGADGLGLISYVDERSHKLKVAHCTNVACTSATISTLGDADSSPTRLVIGPDGLGLIAYSEDSFNKLAHCDNAECTSATTSSLVFDGRMGSLVLGADGLALLTLNFRAIGKNPATLDILHCNNPACTTKTLQFIGIGTPSLGRAAIGFDGLPLVAFANGSAPTRIIAVHCGDAACISPGGSGGPILVGDQPLALGMGSDGLGLLAWTDSGLGLRMAHCSDIPCSSAASTTVDGGSTVSSAAVAAGSDGLGLVAYMAGNALKVAHCSDLACAGSTVSVLDAAAGSLENGLAIGSDGLGLISYSGPGQDGELKVAHCENVPCTSATITILDGSSPVGADLTVSLSHPPLSIYTLQDFSYGIQTSNLGPDPAADVTVTQLLPADVPFRSASGTGWSCAHAGGTVTCTRPTAAPGPLPAIDVGVTAPSTPQVITTTATIASPVFDPDLSTNIDTDQVTVIASQVTDLSVAMSDGGAVVHPGLPFTWTITATNSGATEVGGARLRDVFPPSVSGVAWTCVAPAGAFCPPDGVGDMNVPVSFAAGRTVTFTATGVLSASTYVLTNTATIALPVGYIDSNPADNTATVSSQPEPTQAYTLTPCRVMDTRLTPPPLGANTTRTFTVTGTCAVPADARAVMVNATAVAPGDRGNLRLYPTGANAPLASSLNFAPGRTRANNAVVPLGEGGQISVQCDMPPGSQATTHFVLDVYGYFK